VNCWLVLRAGERTLQANEGKIEKTDRFRFRLVDLLDRTRVIVQAVRIFILDEADRMLDMGFEPQVLDLVQNSLPLCVSTT
jgi:hypothetical protein